MVGRMAHAFCQLLSCRCVCIYTGKKDDMVPIGQGGIRLNGQARWTLCMAAGIQEWFRPILLEFSNYTHQVHVNALWFRVPRDENEMPTEFLLANHVWRQISWSHHDHPEAVVLELVELSKVKAQVIWTVVGMCKHPSSGCSQP